MALLFFLFLANSASAVNVQVLGKLFQNEIVEAGSEYEIEITVVNPTDIVLAVYFRQQDLRTEGEKKDFLPAGTLPRSNAKWIYVKHSSYVVEPKHKVEFKFPVTVPENSMRLEPGFLRE